MELLILLNHTHCNILRDYITLRNVKCSLFHSYQRFSPWFNKMSASRDDNLTCQPWYTGIQELHSMMTIDTSYQVIVKSLVDCRDEKQYWVDHEDN